MSLPLGEKIMAVLAAFSDRWLGTHLGPRLLARYDARIEQLKQELAAIEAARTRLGLNTEALVVSTCTALLTTFERSPNGGLMFEPGAEHQDLLQTSINVLVKHDLASIREHARPGNTFAYELFPHWSQICDHLARLSDTIDSADIAAHVRQNIEQIRASTLQQDGAP
jgi:hypothetical protein